MEELSSFHFQAVVLCLCLDSILIKSVLICVYQFPIESVFLVSFHMQLYSCLLLNFLHLPTVAIKPLSWNALLIHSRSYLSFLQNPSTAISSALDKSIIALIALRREQTKVVLILSLSSSSSSVLSAMEQQMIPKFLKMCRFCIFCSAALKVHFLLHQQ